MLRLKYLLPIITSIIIILPGVNIAGLPLRAEDFIVILILIFAISKTGGKLFEGHGYKTIITIFSLFIFSNFLSLFFSLFRGYNAGFNDINTVFLYVKSLLFLITGFYIGNTLFKQNANYILYSFLGGIVLSSLLSIVQYFDFGGLGTVSYLLYGDERNIEYGIIRAIGTLGNPNYASYFHTLGFIIALNLKSITIRVRTIKYLLLILFATSVILTFSRTGLFVLILAWFFTLLLQGKMKYILSLAFVFGIIITSYIDVIFKGTRFSLIMSGDSGGTISDFGNRSNLIWEHRLASFFDYPLFGIGPAKNQISGTVFGATIYDNAYLLLLITSGLVGIFLYLLWMYKYSKFFIKRRSKDDSISNSILPITATTLLFFITTDMVWSIHYVGYFYLLIGVFYSYKQSKITLHNEATC